MLLSETVTSFSLFNLVPLIVFLPVIGLLVNIIFGGRMKEGAISAVACTAVGLSFVVAVLQAVALTTHPEGVVIPLADWITIGELNVRWAFQVDTLSVTMMLVVSGVGALIHIYAVGYMHEDVRFNGDPGRFRRFFVYMNLFIAAMMILVSGDSYLTLFVGWRASVCVHSCSSVFGTKKGRLGLVTPLPRKRLSSLTGSAILASSSPRCSCFGCSAR